jgi:hypothetical protein
MRSLRRLYFLSSGKTVAALWISFLRKCIQPLVEVDKVAIVNFEDFGETGASMYLDTPDDPSAPIAAIPNTPAIADVTDTDNVLRHIINASVVNPTVARHCMNVINSQCVR